jgi:NADH:ubiquinone oxidoreductase subunit 6 (subunit J)
MNPVGNASGGAQPNAVARILGAPLSIGNALVVLVILGAIVVLVTLAIGPTREGSQTGINSVEYARGLITLIFSGGTMLIAVLLALYVITSDSPHADERFTRGKEVLTILIGVFGTILGFYFGKSDATPPTPASTQQTAPADDAGNTENNNGGDV